MAEVSEEDRAMTFMLPPGDLGWLAPWEPVDDPEEELVAELKKGLGPNHILHGLEFVAVGHRIDCDDFLFATSDQHKPLAVVHLTWTGCTEADPRWPATSTYIDWQDWIDRCLIPDYESF